MNWYALHVQTGKEELVRNRIEHAFSSQELLPVVPKRMLQEKNQGIFREVCRILFPGYVFIRTWMNVDTYYMLKEIPNLYSLLNKYNYENSSDSQFSHIDLEEMAVIVQLIGQDDTIACSTLYEENMQVKVLKGPLLGKEGLIKKIDKRKKRARIALEFLGKEIRLDVGIEWLAPLRYT